MALLPLYIKALKTLKRVQEKIKKVFAILNIFLLLNILPVFKLKTLMKSCFENQSQKQLDFKVTKTSKIDQKAAISTGRRGT